MKYPKEFKDFVQELVSEQKLDITNATKISCEKYGIPYSDSVRRAMSSAFGTKTEDIEVEYDEVFEKAKTKEYDKTKSIFFVTYAQSDTKVNEPMLMNMEAYAEKHNASIHVILGRYKNPTSLEANKNIKQKETNKYNWDELIHQYADSNRHNIHENLCILSDVKIQPTASTPLTGLNGLTGKESCIAGHPRQHLKFLPTLDGEPDKIVCTTGAVTLPNYTDTKVGKVSEFHHTFGFVIVEIDDNDFIIRPVSCLEDGSFCDLKWSVKDGVVEETPNTAQAIVWGDLHYGLINELVLQRTLEQSRLYLNQEDRIYIHDVFDASSISHHDLKDPFVLYQKEGFTLERELNGLSIFLDDLDDEFTPYIVRSNHDEHLDRWLKDTDWRKSNNRDLYLRLSYSKAINPNLCALELAMRLYNTHVTFLDENTSHKVDGIELSIHGHNGVGGSRGSAIQFKNLNTKSITGHTHSPLILDGLMTVGTLTEKRIGYNKGLSAWGWANAIIHHNGKRQLLIINNNYNYTTLI
jgi:hypothetical protein